MRLEVLAETVAEVIAATVGPLQQRVTAVERAWARAEEAMVTPALVADVSRRLDVVTASVGEVEIRSLAACAAVRERVAVLETRELVPGPPGPPGPAGVDGKDGTPGLRYCGVFVDGKDYDLGDGVTWAGSLWHCNGPTTSRPGEGSKVWTLIVKRGRDGRDAPGVR